MFSTFGGAKKREPLFTFKRKAQFIIEDPFIRKPLEETDNLNYNELLIPTLEEITSKELELKKVSTIVPATKLVVPPAVASTNSCRESANSNKNNKRSAKRKEELTTEKEVMEISSEDSIFDFPDLTEEYSEIKVMVASSRPVTETTKLTRKRSKSRNKSPAKPTKSPPKSRKSSSTPTSSSKKKEYTPSDTQAASQNSFDIFDFDPEPTLRLQHKTTTHIPNNTNANPIRRTVFPSEISNPSYQVKTRNTACRQPVSIDNILHNNASDTFSLQPANSQNITHAPEKKRKRNLVAHLKTASGETENKPKHQGFDFLSDEEEFLAEQQHQLPLSPLREIITNKDRSLSPELSYAERMELELDTLMRSEFGNDKTQEKQVKENESNTRRPRYQPLNKLNVRVTF